MIIRKPYAFLIKNFRKIHIVLLILSLFIAYKLFDVTRFINDFMSLGTYDLYADPISRHISVFLRISLLIAVVGSVAILILLRRKGKPWKLYLVPIIEYLALFFVLGIIRSFFNNFTNDVETTDLRFSRDLLYIFVVAQLPAIWVFIMRTLGLDGKKFNFNSDEEFLELSEEDRAEVEISISIDKNSFIRTYKKFLRNAGYFYEEHRRLCNFIIIAIVVLFIFNIGTFIFVTNRSYLQGQTYNVNNMSIVVNKAYITDKDYHGEIISKKSRFVILDVSITNRAATRTIYTDYFHIRAGSDDFQPTDSTYATEFSDLGKVMSSTTKVKNAETVDVLLIYKVDNKMSKDRYVMFYQEKGGKLRKIKLNIEDVSKIENLPELDFDSEINIKTKSIDETITFDIVKYKDEVQYNYMTCYSYGCNNSSATYRAPAGYKILEIQFSSNEFESKNMIDFLNKYGKIIYKDSEGEECELKFTNAVGKKYLGKVLYLKVPKDFETSTDARFVFIVRNKKYEIKL